MLSAAAFDQLSVPIVDLYELFTMSVIRDLARRLGNLSFASASWQVQRLNASGAIYEDILEQLSKLTGQSEAVLRATFEKAGVRATVFDNAIYKAAGLSPLPLNLSPSSLNVLLAGLKKTAGVMRNLTLTTALTGQDAFISAADLAYMQITSGAMDYNSAIRAAVKDVAAKGLDVIRFDGRKESLSVAVRRTVLTGTGQTTAQIQLDRADELGCDLIRVSAHAGARNQGTGPMNHESWQGKVYSRSGTNPKYGNFAEITGYGTGEGLSGWNCRHSFYPWFEGISTPASTQAELDELADKTVTLPGGKRVSQYEASQIQRGLERKIRYWKRQAGAMEAAGFGEEHAEAGLKVKDWQEKLREFVRSTGLIRQSVREQIQ